MKALSIHPIEYLGAHHFIFLVSLLLVIGLFFTSVDGAVEFMETFDTAINNGEPLPDGYQLDIGGVPFRLSTTGPSDSHGKFTIDGSGGLYYYRNSCCGGQWAFLCMEEPIDPDSPFEFCLRSYDRSAG